MAGMAVCFVLLIVSVLLLFRVSDVGRRRRKEQGTGLIWCGAVPEMRVHAADWWIVRASDSCGKVRVRKGGAVMTRK